jgi:hypothetical protein
LITHTQFLVQLDVARTIHRLQGFTLHYVALDPTRATHHDLTYTTLSRIHTKENLYLLVPLQNNNLKVDVCVMEEMHQLCTKVVWKLTITRLSLLCKTHTIIQSLNTRSLPLHAAGIDNDHNLKGSHIICFNGTRLKFKFFYIIYSLLHTKNYQSLMVHFNTGTMFFYNKHMNLYSTNTDVYLGSEIITTSFNNQSQCTIHVIAIYKPPKLPLTHFFNALKQTMFALPPKLSNYCLKKIQCEDA